MNESGSGHVERDLVKWSVPPADESQAITEICARVGGATLIVGANGAGKSALGFWLQSLAHGVPVRRILAHRRLWFESDGPAISASDRQNLTANLQSWSMDINSRYIDYGNTQRTNIVLYDLLAKLADRNQRLADLVAKRVPYDELETRVEESPLTRLNSLLERSELPVRISTTESSTFQATNIATGASYGIPQLSDGEKSALLLAAEVLTSPPDAVLIIDEPERHLHRSISAKLISAVIAERPDCHTVILTHDLELAAVMSTESTATFSLLGCSWSGQITTGWHLQQVPADGTFPELARRAILGGRHKLMFIEGEATSLDVKLFSILFPGWTHTSVGSCEQVIRAVSGLRKSDQLHWIDAVGIVDNDGRTSDEIGALSTQGVHVLPVSEIENLYYSGPVVEAVATRQQITLERSAEDLVSEVRSVALKAVSTSGTSDRLAASVSAASAQRRVVDQLPTPQGLIAGGPDRIVFDVASPFPEWQLLINQHIANGDLEAIIREFPIRDTSLRTDVSRVLGFQRPSHYESVARQLLSEDVDLRSAVLDLVGTIPV